MTPRIGSLFSGYGGLCELGLAPVIGGQVVWFAQYEPPSKQNPRPAQEASKVLAHHWPDVPNHGDVTTIDWSTVEPVDWLAGGFPCTDVSLAGLREGLRADTRSGLWFWFAQAITALRPRFVLIENVEGLRSADADCPVEPCAGCLGDEPGEPPLRALGAVLGDLASLGYDAEWVSVRASDVGGAHKRERVFVLAVRAPAVAIVGSDGRTVAPDDGDPGPPPDSRGDRCPWHPERDLGAEGGLGAPRRDDPARCDVAAADTDRLGRERPGSGPRQAGGGGLEDDPCAAADTDIPGRQGPEPAIRRDLSAWGPYAAAISRWETVMGPAPAPTETGRNGQPRLAAPFVEWLMGLPAGHVTAVPGVNRNQAIRMCGNGVVPMQAAAAVRLLLRRMHDSIPNREDLPA